MADPGGREMSSCWIAHLASQIMDRRLREAVERR